MPVRRDYYDNTLPENKEATCRTCTDFKSWSKVKKSSNLVNTFTEDNQVQDINNQSPDCPLGRIALGRSAWSLLHSMSAAYPVAPTAKDQNDMINFFMIFSRVYPCHMCAEHFRQQLAVSPPIVKSQQELKDWLCLIHNDVNKRLGKPEFDCKLIDERWKVVQANESCNV